ncbi:MAG: hypothetical protein EPN76_10930 [Burkholderiaceae bacterium]|nr:MAG: hypothetical protein EPN76_10930 [Burkholderiaceae bacterium]TAM03203.1 MAG: hypothetical protein EPN67_09945 [Pusillimonas sp.]
MQIVLPGALPGPNAASALIPHVLKAAPTLVSWLEQGRATVQKADPSANGCTSLEQWLLQSRGFIKHDGQNLGSGLGPLWANKVSEDDQAIWLVELVHVSPSRDSAVLLPAHGLDIRADHSGALLESAQALFAGTGFTLQPDSTTHWRIHLPPDFTPLCASPALVSLTTLNDYWPQDLNTRPWRRLVNELQMLWYEHPVNTERGAEGLAPINSLWLFGGASPSQLTKATPEPAKHDDLFAPGRVEDWGGWIAALANLEQTVFKPLAASGAAPELALLGRNRIIEITPRTPGLLSRFLPHHKQAWRIWWSSQD